MRTFEELRNFAEEHGLIQDGVVQRLLYKARLKPETIPQIARSFVRLVPVEEVAVRKIFRVSDPNSIIGDYILGWTDEGYAFGMDANRFCEHLMIIGRSGAGKTSAIYNLIMNIYGRPFIWIFDFKRDFRHLTRHLDFVVIRPNDSNSFKWNPLCPPIDPATGKLLVTLREWFPIISKNLSQELGFLFGSESYLSNKLNELSALASGIPTIFDLVRLLRLNRKPSYPENQSHFRNIERLKYLISIFGAVFACQKDVLPSLTEMNVIFELDLLPGETQSLVASCLTDYLMKMAIATGRNSGQLRWLLINDEGTRVWSADMDRDSAMGIRTQQLGIKQVREYGLGLVIADQSCRGLTKVVPENTMTKIAMSMVDGLDADLMANHMALTEQQALVLRQGLPVGTGIVKIANKEPFILEFPNVYG